MSHHAPSGDYSKEEVKILKIRTLRCVRHVPDAVPLMESIELEFNSVI